MKTHFKTKVISSLPVIFLIIVLAISLMLSSCGETKYKNYVIEHANEISKHISNDNYHIDSCEFSYYTDITIRMIDDSCYTIVFWGDRDSWLWDFKLDKHFIVDIPYNRYKGKNVDKDIEIIRAVNK